MGGTRPLLIHEDVVHIFTFGATPLTTLIEGDRSWVGYLLSRPTLLRTATTPSEKGFRVPLMARP